MYDEDADAETPTAVAPRVVPRTAWVEPKETTPPPQSLALATAHADPSAAAQSSKSFFGRIRVVIRCRPLQGDIESDHTDHRVHTHGDEVIVCEKNNPTAGRSFRFDRVLGSDADQTSAFAEVAPLVDHVLDGFHATVFAYGQTGSGKTYTMDGLRYTSSRQKGSAAMVPDPEGTPLEQHGIMPRMIQLLFDRARARQGSAGAMTEEGEDDDGVEYTFRCSYYQIYNEKITDLLRTTASSPDPNGNRDGAEEAGDRRRPRPAASRFDDNGLRVRWQKGDVFKVENLFVCSCASPDEMREMLFTGIQQKVVSSHLMNYQSSRSHCVFTVYVECRARKNGELRSRSELSLVDLAGSEKIGLLSSNPSAKLVKESIDINTSLLALGKVIMALSSSSSTSSSGAGKGRQRAGGAASHAAAAGRVRRPRYGTGGTAGAATAHIPYRDSKLTMLLKHALGGNSLTTMIACISPSDRYVEETTSTLLYAGRAKNIRNAPRINEDATTTLIRQLREEIAQLKAELSCYREMAARSLGQSEATAAACPRCGGEAEAVSALAAPRPAGAAATVNPREAEQLADSLIAACEMLKNMMAVNAELRDAYDDVRDSQEAAERREGDVNAENLALRERLAVLESIVLQDDEDEEEEHHGSKNDRRHKELMSDEREVSASLSAQATREALAAAKEATEAAEAIRRHGGREQPFGNSSRTTPQTLTSAVPLPSSHAVNFDSPSSPALEHVRVTPVGASTSRESLPHVVTPVTPAPAAVSKKKSNSSRPVSPPASERKPALPPQARGQHKSKMSHKKNKKKKKHRVLARRLKEYEQHYRAPSKVQSYDDYYQSGSNNSRMSVAGSVAAGAASAAAAVLPIRASDPERAQVTATLEDMKATVAKLPKNVVPDYVPASLLRPGLFGSLAFGGKAEERREFEQHRSDRAARLRALQQQQQELYKQVHQTVKDTMQPKERVRSDDDGSPRSASASRRSSEYAGDAGRRGSSGSAARRPSGDLYAPYSSLPSRQPTAAYPVAKAAKQRSSHAKESVNSMAQLMEYLDKER